MKKLIPILFSIWLYASSTAFAVYPDRPITIIHPFFTPPIGNTGGTILALKPLVEKTLGVPLVVIGRGGGQTAIGAQAVWEAKPDGYTLLAHNANFYALKERGEGKVGIEDLSIICQLASSPIVLLVKNDLPVNNFKEFVGYIKKNLGKVTWVGGRIGGNAQMSYMVLLKNLGLNPQTAIIARPAIDGPRAIEEFKANHGDFITLTLAEAQALIQNKAGKPLLLFAVKRRTDVPNIPTTKEASGIDFTIATWQGLFGPKGLSNEVIKKISNAFKSALANHEGFAAIQKINLDPDFLGPDEFAKKISREEKQMKQLTHEYHFNSGAKS